METIKFNGSHEGAQIRSNQKELTLEEQKTAIEAINAFIEVSHEAMKAINKMEDYSGAVETIQSLVDDYQNACHARSYSGVKD